MTKRSILSYLYGTIGILVFIFGCYGSIGADEMSEGVSYLLWIRAIVFGMIACVFLLLSMYENGDIKRKRKPHGKCNSHTAVYRKYTCLK